MRRCRNTVSALPHELDGGGGESQAILVRGVRAGHEVELEDYAPQGRRQRAENRAERFPGYTAVFEGQPRARSAGGILQIPPLCGVIE